MHIPFGDPEGHVTKNIFSKLSFSPGTCQVWTKVVFKETQYKLKIRITKTKSMIVMKNPMKVRMSKKNLIFAKKVMVTLMMTCTSHILVIVYVPEN